MPFPTLSLTRGGLVEAAWMANRESTSTLNEEEQFKAFDHVNESLWNKLNPLSSQLLSC